MTRPWMPVDGPTTDAEPPPTQASPTLAVVAVMALAAWIAWRLSRRRP